MRQFKFAAALLATAVLAGCGGGGAGDQSPKVKFTSMVSFGDSLSDVGTYATAGLKAATGGAGGKYTINGPSGKNWTELIAAQIGTSAPCAAQTGLNSTGQLAGFAEAVANHSGCYNYAQGGARVTNPIGPANAALIALGDTSGYLGQLTVPVVTQISNHLAATGGSFSGNELVTVLAGGNDVFMNLATVGSTGPTTAVTAMGTAGAQLANYINTQIVAKGAKYVVVVNLPDVSQTPYAAAKEAQFPGTQALINTMVTTFNAQLSQGLAGNANVLYVDAYTVGRDQNAHPAQYGLTNVTTPACNLSAPSNPLQSSLMCNSTNLIPGVVDHYEYADAVHPTPYGYQLLAQLVASEMAKKGWL